MASPSYRERTEGTITSTKLEDFAFCEELYRLKWIEGATIEDEEAEEDSKALIIGSAYDLYMQSVEKFNETYSIVPKRTGATGKIELTMADGKLVRKMAAEMQRQTTFYNPIGQKQFHIKVRLQNGLVISGTLDEFQEKQAIVIDDKTSAGLRKFEDFREKYKRQVSFYAFIVWLGYKLLCDGMIRMVTKDDIPKAMFYSISSDDLRRHWPEIIRLLDRLKECIDTGIFRPSPREKCLGCPAYAKCPHSIQKELYPL